MVKQPAATANGRVNKPVERGRDAPTGGLSVSAEDMTKSFQSPPANPTYRKVFWSAAGFSWLVWLLAVSAASDEHWGELPEGHGFGVEEGFVECNEGGSIDPFCTTLTLFAGFQTTGTVSCSIAVVLFTVAFFRPSEARRGSSKSLGVAGGVLMALFAFCQIMAFLFLARSIQELNDAWVSNGQGYYEADPGNSYSLGLLAFATGLGQAVVVLFYFRQAGNGPLCRPAPVMESPLPAPSPASLQRSSPSGKDGAQSFREAFGAADFVTVTV